MSYTGSELAEYPVKVENGLSKDDSGDLTFLCREEDDGVIPPPTPLDVHIDTWCGNIQYGSSVHVHNRRLSSKDSVDKAYRRGYILSLPGEIGFSRKKSTTNSDKDNKPYTVPFPTMAFRSDEYLEQHTHPEQTGREYPTYRLDLRWAVSVPDGYSVLVTDPFFTASDDYKVIPIIHDVDENFTWLSVSLEIYNADFRINLGEPIVQVIPIKRESSRLPVEIDRTTPSVD